jgi:hypothetical protein
VTAAALRLSEADWQQRVTDLADLRGWGWVHFRPARTQQGWRTPVSGPLGVGWPDLVLVRGERAIAVELKSAAGRASAAQVSVLEVLGRVSGVEALVARPSDWDRVQKLLT